MAFGRRRILDEREVGVARSRLLLLVRSGAETAFGKPRHAEGGWKRWCSGSRYECCDLLRDVDDDSSDMRR